MKYAGKKPNHISYSQCDTGKCLYRYLKLRLLKDVPNESLPMKLGSAAHKFIFKYTKACMEQKFSEDFELAKDIIDKEFKRAKLPESEYQAFREQMLAFAEKGIDYNSISEIEHPETIDIGDGVKVKAIIDRINFYNSPETGYTLEILDYKRSMYIPPKHEVESNQQLQIYAYLACKFIYKKVDTVRWGIYCIPYTTIKWTDFKITGELEKQFEGTENFLVRQWDRLINSKEYPAERGEHCFQYGGCPVMDQCPKFTKTEMAKLKTGSIEDKVMLYRKTKHEAEAIYKEVKEYFKDKDNKEIEGKSVGYTASTSYKYNLGKLLEFCKGHKIDIGALLVAKTAIDKMLKTQLNDDMKKELQGCQEEETSTRFSI